MAYQLQLRVKIHDVFHVVLLKKYEGPVSTQPVPLPDLLHGRVLLTRPARSAQPGYLGAFGQVDKAVRNRCNVGAARKLQIIVPTSCARGRALCR
jgi:hypothetical protein